MVAYIVGVEGLGDAGAERGDERADAVAGEHLVEPGALDIEDLAPERQHRLEGAVAALLGGAAGAVALDDEQLRLVRVARLAVRELARQRGDGVLRLADERARAPGRLAGLGGALHLLDDDPRLFRVLLQPRLQRLVMALSTAGRTSEETSLSLVWEENFGSGTLIESTQVRPSRTSSPESASLSRRVRPMRSP